MERKRPDIIITSKMEPAISICSIRLSGYPEPPERKALSLNALIRLNEDTC